MPTIGSTVSSNTNAEIAARPYTSGATVKSHAMHLFDKLSATNRDVDEHPLGDRAATGTGNIGTSGCAGIRTTRG